MINATVEVDVGSTSKAEKIFQALSPEVRSSKKFKSKVYISLEGDIVTLVFQAPSITALRAALNSFVRWMSLLEKTLEVLGS